MYLTIFNHNSNFKFVWTDLKTGLLDLHLYLSLWISQISGWANEHRLVSKARCRFKILLEYLRKQNYPPETPGFWYLPPILFRQISHSNSSLRSRYIRDISVYANTLLYNHMCRILVCTRTSHNYTASHFRHDHLYIYAVYCHTTK